LNQLGMIGQRRIAGARHSSSTGWGGSNARPGRYCLRLSMLSRAFFLSASEFSVGAGCAPDCDWLLCASEGAAASKKANNPNRFSLRQIERFITPLAAPLDSEGHSPEKPLESNVASDGERATLSDATGLRTCRCPRMVHKKRWRGSVSREQSCATSRTDPR
jgi:hypothetical protein